MSAPVTALPVHVNNHSIMQPAVQYENDPKLAPLQPLIDRAFKEMNISIAKLDAHIVLVEERMNTGAARKIIAAIRIAAYTVFSWISPTKAWRTAYTAKAVAGFAFPALYSPGNGAKREEWKGLRAQRQELETLKMIFSDAAQLKGWIAAKQTQRAAAERIQKNYSFAQGEAIGLEENPDAVKNEIQVPDFVVLKWGMREVHIIL